MAYGLVSGALPSSFKPLKIGAGGFVPRLSIANDGTKAIGTDVGGGYVCDSGGIWQQILLASKLPPGDPSVALIAGTGLYEICVAPSDSRRMYMLFGPFATAGYVYRSDDGARRWAATSFSSVTVTANDQDQEGMGQRMVVDPHNPDILFVGTPGSGVFRTANGGTTFGSAIATIPVCTTVLGTAVGQKGGHCIAFDPSSWSSGNTPGIYASVYGTGLYHSTDSGATFSQIVATSTPSDIWQLRVAPNGDVWVIRSSGAIMKFSGGVWTTYNLSVVLNTGGGLVNCVAVNPLNSSEVLAMPSGVAEMAYTSNGGTTWTRLPVTASSSDIPWLAPTAGWGNGHTAIAQIAFDPSASSATPGSSVLWIADGLGVWKCNLSGAGTQTVTSQSAGIEELVVDWIVHASGKNPMVACYDRPVFTITDPTNASYPSTYGPVTTPSPFQVLEGFSIDYAKDDPSFAVVLTQNGNIAKTTNNGGTDGGPANWSLVLTSTLLDLVGNSATAGGQSGHLAVSTTLNYVVALGNGAGGDAGIWATLNGGTNWTKGTCSAHPFGSGVNGDNTGTTSLDGWGLHSHVNRHILEADYVTAGMFTAYNQGGITSGVAGGGSTPGVYRSTDGGLTWTLQNSGKFDVAIPNGNNDDFQAQLRAVPGKAGHAFFTCGSTLTTGTHLFYSMDGAASVWNTFANVSQVFAFGFGKARPASSGYPTIYLYGAVNGVFGIWQGYNLDTTPVWVPLCSQYVGDRLDYVTCVEGDKDIYGKVYVGFTGTGAMVGRF